MRSTGMRITLTHAAPSYVLGDSNWRGDEYFFLSEHYSGVITTQISIASHVGEPLLVASEKAVEIQTYN